MTDSDKTHPFSAAIGLMGIILSVGVLSVENGTVIIIALALFILSTALFLYGENGLERRRFVYVPVTLLGLHFLVSAGMKGEGLILYAFIAVMMSSYIRSSYHQKSED